MRQVPEDVRKERVSLRKKKKESRAAAGRDAATTSDSEERAHTRRKGAPPAPPRPFLSRLSPACPPLGSLRRA